MLNFFYSSRAYDYLRNSNLLLAPCKNTLKKRISEFECKPGLSEMYINLAANSQKLDQFGSFGVLCFDEMDIKEIIQYDSVNKCVYGPAKKVQAVILRGLTSKWKQLIFYDFDVKMTKNLLLSIISKCEEYGIKIHAVIFDMGNHTFMSQFRILDGTNKIKNPSDPSRSVYFFPDAPHLLKLLRNHCLDKGYSFPDGSGNNVTLGKEDFEKLLMQDGKELKICPKLTADHIYVKGSGRQRVRTAAQLFSETVGKAFIFHFGDLFAAQSKFILDVNYWFDTLNSRSKFSSAPYRSGFGVRLENQTRALESMRALVETMRFANNTAKTAKLPFQKGILLSINSLLGLFKDLQKEGVDYLLTKNLNQDCLENFFSLLRSFGTSHPGPVDVMHKIKLILVGANPKNALSVSNPSVEMETPQGSEEKDTEFVSSLISSQVNYFNVNFKNI